MKISIKHGSNPDMIHAVMRMTEKEFKALHNYMHCTGAEIKFPYGAYVTVRGRGWYRIIPNNDVKAVDKIHYAAKCVRMFMRDEEQATTEAIKLLIPTIKHPDTKLSAFSTYHSERDLMYLSNQQPPKPATESQLQRLAMKFSRT